MYITPLFRSRIFPKNGCPIFNYSTPRKTPICDNYHPYLTALNDFVESPHGMGIEPFETL